MIKLISNKEYYNMISSEGESHIKSLHSPIVIGQLIRKRLDYIFKWKFGG